ncbi:helix-turn-helix domain-containing protein [Stackebrandtia nassauensis]|uniref:Putative transcriptional regulator, XRE family n=1 Tax=Stackebrandtia nassauensis (strain DSM 44728 / CIP 108903 / NRRL B-16338 / NBRC 102104 / LLR-40K-21) TaxID=446470 RepID=D3PVU1_STANL|nr:helix-turn-helix transcriptional regulator [Stackebrandtia nassauensis]ADD45062.1 putative transcriptional regulator, XRE family [Stackebrandtia nassauensis DSM 44728]
MNDPRNHSSNSDHDDAHSGRGRLARRLDALFVNQGVSNSKVADDLTNAGVKVSHGYLSLLRRDQRDDPSYRLLQALADYFGVTTEYFSGPDPDYQDNEVAAVMEIANAERVRAIAHHASGLSPESVELIQLMIAKARAAEGLPPIEAKAPRSENAGNDPDVSSSENPAT